MKNTILLCILFVNFWGCQGQSSSPIVPDHWEASVDALVQDYEQLDIFSGVVLLAKDGTPFYHKAFGLANRETGEPNTLQTKFILGSMNKSFTKAVVAQLIAEGKLRLEDRLVDHLQGFQQAQIDEVRVHHLLDHTSGFGDYHSPDFFDLPLGEKGIATVTEIARTLPLLFPPGEGDEYSNTGYVLLGAIIEKVSGKSYAQNVRERIVEPLNLKETYVDNVMAIPHRSVGYMRTINGMVDNLDFLMEPKPDGGFWATASDVLTFYRAFFFGDQIIPARMREEISFFQEIAPYYEEPGTGIPMAGGAEGLNTVHIEMLKDGYSITVLANMDEPVAEKIGLGILGIIKGREPEPAQLPAILNAYQVFQEKGLEYLKDHFEEVTANFHPTDPRDLILNNLGYTLLFNDQVEEAIQILQLNTELFPRVANVWDSLGEAWLAQGDQEKALIAYEKALSIDPNLPTAQDAVRRLRQ